MEKGRRNLRVDLSRDETEFATRLVGLEFARKALEDVLLVSEDGTQVQILSADIRDMHLEMDEGWSFMLRGEIIPLRPRG